MLNNINQSILKKNILNNLNDKMLESLLSPFYLIYRISTCTSANYLILFKVFIKQIQ